jgi:dCTP diphosphatase
MGLIGLLSPIGHCGFNPSLDSHAVAAYIRRPTANQEREGGRAPDAMPDQSTTVADLRERMRLFVAERDWEQFHSPKNLVMGLSVEVAELMEHFLWMDNDASRRVLDDPAKRVEVADELADVTCYILALCNTLGLDLSESVAAKMVKTGLKYPVERCRGRYKVEDEKPMGTEM